MAKRRSKNTVKTSFLSSPDSMKSSMTVWLPSFLHGRRKTSKRGRQCYLSHPASVISVQTFAVGIMQISSQTMVALTTSNELKKRKQNSTTGRVSAPSQRKQVPICQLIHIQNSRKISFARRQYRSSERKRKCHSAKCATAQHGPIAP